MKISSVTFLWAMLMTTGPMIRGAEMTTGTEITIGAADIYVCDGARLTLPGDVAAMVFQLEGEEAGRTFSPVEIRNNVLLYHKSRPGDDDERIVTARMLRFDTQTLHLIYLENLDGDPLLLESYCTMHARVHD